MSIDNNSGYAVAQIETFTLLGTFRNNWRLRDVAVYAHPTDTSKVVTVGTGFDAAKGRTTICTEDRSAYARQLVKGNWSPVN